jgi:hypothetical protein
LLECQWESERQPKVRTAAEAEMVTQALITEFVNATKECVDPNKSRAPRLEDIPTMVYEVRQIFRRFATRIFQSMPRFYPRRKRECNQATVEAALTMMNLQGGRTGQILYIEDIIEKTDQYVLPF